MKKILLWGVIIGFLALPSVYALGPITGMGWNGDYWLTGGKFDSSVLMIYDGYSFTDLTGDFMSAGQAKPPSSPPPPPPAGYPEAVFTLLFLALIAVLVLIWKSGSRGAILGALWGMGGLVTYVAFISLGVKGTILQLAVQIIALPSIMWSKIAYKLGGGGSAYDNPLVVLILSAVIGAVLGFVIEKGYSAKASN